MDVIIAEGYEGLSKLLSRIALSSGLTPRFAMSPTETLLQAKALGAPVVVGTFCHPHEPFDTERKRYASHTGLLDHVDPQSRAEYRDMRDLDEFLRGYTSPVVIFRPDPFLPSDYAFVSKNYRIIDKWNLRNLRSELASIANSTLR